MPGAVDPKTAKPVRDQLADMLLFLVRLSSVLGVKLDEAVRLKLDASAQRYPDGDSTPKRQPVWPYQGAGRTGAAGASSRAVGWCSTRSAAVTVNVFRLPRLEAEVW